VLLAQQTAKIEETLWVALRMFEERQNLLAVMSGREGGKSRSLSQRIEDSKVHIDRIRAMLSANGKDSLNKGALTPAVVANK
jgi:two-component system chemotaxis response regulator CheB